MRRVGRARVGDARGRGRGHRQRASAFGSAVASTTAKFLTEMWAFGVFTASMVQRLGKMIVDDHVDPASGLATSPPDLVTLSELGNSGASSQHCYDQMSNRVAKIHGAPEPVAFPLSMKSLKRRGGEEVVALCRGSRTNVKSHVRCLCRWRWTPITRGCCHSRCSRFCTITTPRTLQRDSSGHRRSVSTTRARP